MMMHGEAARAFDRLAVRLVRQHDLTGAMFGVVSDQDLIWSRGLGSPDRARPLDEHTLSRVASITKTFTATAIVQLRDAGMLRLDDPLVAHLPEFGAVRNPFGPIEDVTLRKLLCHHGGIVGEPPTGHWQSLRFPARDEVLSSLPCVEVVIPPGSAFKYSNLGYTLLGEVVARTSGRPVLDYLRSELLEPLGMTDSTFAPTERDRPRIASGHLAHPFEDWATPAPASPTHGMAAAAELYASVHDLARWLSLQFRVDAPERDGAQVLPGASLAEMHRPQYVEPDWSLGSCLGWRANRSGTRIWHGHGGGLPGFRSQILFNVPERVGAIVLIDAWDRPTGSPLTSPRRQPTSWPSSRLRPDSPRRSPRLSIYAASSASTAGSTSAIWPASSTAPAGWYSSAAPSTRPPAPRPARSTQPTTRPRSWCAVAAIPVSS